MEPSLRKLLWEFQASKNGGLNLGTACGHRIKWTGLEIFKGLTTNRIQRVKKNLKWLPAGLGNWDADKAKHLGSDS